MSAVVVFQGKVSEGGANVVRRPARAGCNARPGESHGWSAAAAAAALLGRRRAVDRNEATVRQNREFLAMTQTLGVISQRRPTALCGRQPGHVAVALDPASRTFLLLNLSFRFCNPQKVHRRVVTVLAVY